MTVQVRGKEWGVIKERQLGGWGYERTKVNRGRIRLPVILYDYLCICAFTRQYSVTV